MGAAEPSAGLALARRENRAFFEPSRPGAAVTTRREIPDTVGEWNYRPRSHRSNEADDLLVDGEPIGFTDASPEPNGVGAR